MIKENCYDEKSAKRRIQSSLRQASRNRKVEPSNIKDDERVKFGLDGDYRCYEIK
jgi:hypothetical protein